MKAGQKAESRFKGCMIIAVAAVTIAAILAICCIFINDDSQVAAESGNLDENISWTFDPNTGALTIQGTGDMPTVQGYGYPWKAFDVRTVTISNGVTSIAEEAFADCTEITSVSLPDSLASIGYAAFRGCHSLGNFSKIPEGLGYIGNEAFRDCRSLTSFNIPSSCSRLGANLFKDSSLTYLTSSSGGSLTEIKTNTFYGCPDLRYVTLPDSMPRICYNAFDDCPSIVQIEIPSASHIDDYAFNAQCKIPKLILGAGIRGGVLTQFSFYSKIFEVVNLTEIDEDYLTSHYVNCVKYCDNPIRSHLQIINDYYAVWFDGIEAYLLKYFGKEAQPTLPDKIGGKDYTIKEYAFFKNNSIVDLTIPSSVACMESFAIEECGSIRTIRISDNAGSIKESAFTACPALIYAHIGSSVSINGGLFYICPVLFEVINLSGCEIDCGALNVFTSEDDRTIELIDGRFYVGRSDGINYLVRYIGDDTDVVLPETVNGGDYRLFDNSFSGWSPIETISIPDSVTAIGANAFLNSPLTSITIPDSVTSIGSDAFTSSHLTSLTIPDSVVTLGDRFCYLSKIESLTIGDSVVSIPDGAFAHCYNLESVSIGESVESIGESAFLYCRAISEIYFGSSITAIEDDAFHYEFCNSSGDPFDTAVSLRGKTFTFENDMYLHLPAIKIDTAGGNNIDPLIGHAGDPVSAPSDPVREGYDFLGWTYNSQPYEFTAIPNDDITIRAEWGAIGYTVTFYSEGVLFFSEDLDYDQLVILPTETPVKQPTDDTVYPFTCWSGYTQGMKVNGNMQFDAVFTPAPREYAVTFLSDGTEYDRMMMHYQDTIVLPVTDPTKPSDNTYDYSFNSWSGYTTGMKVGGDVTFNAIFDRTYHEYSVVFSCDGSVVSQTTKHYGDAITAPNTVPVKDPTPTYEYTFYGWEGYSHNMTVTEDVEFEAMFTETFREYTVTFLFNNEVYRSDRLHYNATIALPLENPSIPSDDTYDHVFAGWEGYTNGMKVTDSVSFNAVFNDVYREYTIVFSVDNAVVSMESKHFSDPISAPDITPSKDSDERFDYVFSGWDGYSDGMNVTKSMSFPAVFHKYVKILKDADGRYTADADDGYASFTGERMKTIVNDAKNDPSVTLKVSIGGASVSFDNASLRTLGSGAAELSLGQMTPDKLDDATKSIVGNNPVYSIDFGDNKNFGDGIVTVGLPYVLEDGKDPSRLSIYYISDGKVAEKMECQYENGNVTFATGHFSTYAIMYEEPESGPGFPIVYVAIGAVAVLAVAGAVFFFARKH